MLCMLMPRVERLCRVADVDGGKTPGNAQGDQTSVKAKHKAVNCMDTFHQLHGEYPQPNQLPQAFRRNGDVGDFLRDGGAVADGDSHIGFGQGGRVVDAVSHHNNGVPLCPQRRNIICLVLRQHLSTKFINPDMGSNRFGRAPLSPVSMTAFCIPSPRRTARTSGTSSRRGSAMQMTAAS